MPKNQYSGEFKEIIERGKNGNPIFEEDNFYSLAQENIASNHEKLEFLLTEKIEWLDIISEKDFPLSNFIKFFGVVVIVEAIYELNPEAKEDLVIHEDLKDQVQLAWELLNEK